MNDLGNADKEVAVRLSLESWVEMRWAMCVLSHSVVSDSLWPFRWEPIRLLCTWDFSGKNTGVGCHFHQGIFPIQISNPCLLNCRSILYMLGHQRYDERIDSDVNDLGNADGRSGCEAEFWIVRRNEMCREEKSSSLGEICKVCALSLVRRSNRCAGMFSGQVTLSFLWQYSVA